MAEFIQSGQTVYEADIDNLVNFSQGEKVLSGCDVTAQASPNMTVKSSAGFIQYGATIVPVIAVDPIAVSAADPTNPRVDLVEVDGITGAVTIKTGTPAATPKPPTLTAGRLLLKYVSVGIAAVNIQSSNLTERRIMGPDAVPAGTLAARPAAAVAGNGGIYVGTDTLSLYRSNGTTWITIGGGMTNPMTTTGDLIIGGASGVPTRLAYVADTVMLTGVGGSPAWAVRPWYSLAKQVTTTTIVNTTTETDLSRTTIGAGAMGAPGVLRLKLYGTYVNTSAGASTLQIRVKFGATTVLDTGAFSMPIANIKRWELEVLIWNTGVTNSQRAVGRMLIGAAASNFLLVTTAPTNAFGDGTATEDTTAAKDLAVTAQHGTALATIEVTSKEGVLELMT